jgi:hypothetical protein
MENINVAPKQPCRHFLHKFGIFSSTQRLNFPICVQGQQWHYSNWQLAFCTSCLVAYLAGLRRAINNVFVTCDARLWAKTEHPQEVIQTATRCIQRVVLDLNVSGGKRSAAAMVQSDLTEEWSELSNKIMYLFRVHTPEILKTGVDLSHVVIHIVLDTNARWQWTSKAAYFMQQSRIT